MRPAIVISAYNRPAALRRLLSSLRLAKFPAAGGVTLHFSIDGGEGADHREVRRIAEDFAWEHGEKKVVCHSIRLGLVQNFYYCAGLSEAYSANVLLKDDLVVSPVFYSFACQTLEFYAADERLAGISLYALWYNGYNHHPFIPLSDESDVFFLQAPYIHGQVFSHRQWQRFQEWQTSSGRSPTSQDLIHEMFLHFDREDLFPVRMKYLIDTGRLYVFPREALVTGFGDAGVHFSEMSYFFQAPLQRFKESYRLKLLDESVAVYDSFFEILPDRLSRLNDQLCETPYIVDLYDTKTQANLEKY